jgi:hypothetical protein
MMLMIEEALDPKQERPRWVEHGANPADKLTVIDLQREVNARLAGNVLSSLPKLREHRTAGRRRTTVWFNAWKYESANQVWAGLVDAILRQVPMRLSRKERELFWVRLNLSRVDGARVRQSLHEYFFDRFFRSSVGAVWAITAAVVTFLLAKLGLTASGSTPYSALLGVGVGAFVKFLLTKAEFKEEAVSEMFKSLVQAPAYDKELGFVHQAESDLRRVFQSLPASEGLVIFIDDLDRCSPMKVASVLEAVNLIIAGDFPDCYFVLGMDAEMVAAALQAAHKDLTSNASDDSRIPIGWRFMDKFVQLPFVVPPLERQQEELFLKQLSGTELKKGSDGAHEPAPEPAANRPPVTDLPDFIALTNQLAPFFSGNPRELKRFTNLLRFHWFLWIARHRQGGSIPSAVALACWTAMSVKWPEHARWLRRIEERIPASATLRTLQELPDKEAAGSLKKLKEIRADGFELPSHLKILEALSQDFNDTGSFTRWRQTLRQLYDMGEKPAAWVDDKALFEFYRWMGKKLLPHDVLSEQVGKGFW